jgi:hypothetical protein
MILLANAMPPSKLRAFNGPAQEEHIRIIKSKKALKTMISALKSETALLREKYQIHATEEDLLIFLDEALQGDSGQAMYYWVHPLRDRFLKQYDDLPLHARVEIDVRGMRPESSGFEYRLLEATLFEDVCALFNQAWEQHKTLGGRCYPKQNLKQMHALFRATMSAVFYLVEGYVNGLAFDHIMRFSSTISVADLSLLTEWDSEKNRPRFISTRDKLLQYPRIILGLQAPPLQESNCYEMKLIIEQSKEIRDSIVHCSPFPHLQVGAINKQLLLTKEELFYSLSMRQVEELVDAAIGLVRKLNDLVNDGKPLKWLYDRSPDGPFSSEVFE